MAAGVTPILKRGRSSRGKQLITYSNGQFERSAAAAAAQTQALVDSDDIHAYTRQLRIDGRGNAANGGLVYLLPTPNKGALALQGRSPLSSAIVSSASDETTSRRSTRGDGRKATNSPQFILNSRERVDENLARLPPSAVFLPPIDLASQQQFQRQNADGRQLTNFDGQQQQQQSFVSGSQRFVLQPYRPADQADVTANRTPVVTNPMTNQAAGAPPKNGVHFEDDVRLKYAGASSNALYDEINRPAMNAPTYNASNSYKRYLSWKNYANNNTNTSMVSCMKIVFHMISLLLSIVAITLAVMVATGYIRVPPDTDTQLAGNQALDNNPWRQRDANGFQSGNNAGVDRRIPFGQDSQFQPNQPNQLNRIARIGVLWQRLEDMDKAANENSQVLHSTEFAQAKLTEQIRRLESMLTSSHEAIDLLSTTYVHWGRRSCPSSAVHNSTVHVVYSGIVAGSADSQPGNGANPLCMPMQPSWGAHHAAPQRGGKLYGATYRLGVMSEGVYNVFAGNAQPGGMNRRPIPCTVCRVQRATTILQLPATNLCPDGYRHLYDGYLLSAAATQFKSQYLCFDKQSENATTQLPADMQVPTPQMSLFPVEAQCKTNLPCQQFTNNREMTCVVCVA
ncbi:uncharacterized protein LOC135809100 isoform X2 [Sycon ciliatum]|uniref:uncharacterized protein LOC135809100 isoform X2 n=1 Tax=Sycon ciliatum TaxID=27933 RepID=UPI0020AE371F|eukprot:scpid30539/ scgid5166/ 